MAAIRISRDRERVSALRGYGVLDTGPEPSYDEITRLASYVTQCPVATIGFIDDQRYWHKSRCGLPRGEITRELSFCSVTICGTDLVVMDLAADERFRDHPKVAGDPHFRFYCGMPLINSDGFALGTLCVMDFQPRNLTYEQKEAIRTLAHQTTAQLELRRKLAELGEAHRQIEAERAESESLLLNVLPKQIAQELRQRGHVEPRYHASATVLFADFSGFTKLAESYEPRQLILQLHDYFSRFDEIVGRHGLEKLKSIGDCYMAVGGVPEPTRTHVFDAALAALEMSHYLQSVNQERINAHLAPWPLRIGLHTGPVIAGVIGSSKFAYDIWGDTVNVASRIESGCPPGSIMVSEYVSDLISEFFELKSIGSMVAKNKGELQVYVLERIKPQFSQGDAGSRPNSKFFDKVGYDLGLMHAQPAPLAATADERHGSLSPRPVHLEPPTAAIADRDSIRHP